MAEPLSPEEARQRLRAVLRGRHLTDTHLDVATAKARLREVDPGIDIGPLLQAVAGKRWKPALVSLLPWFMTPEGRAYVAPLLLAMLDAADRALKLFARRHAAAQPAPAGESAASRTTSPNPSGEA